LKKVEDRERQSCCSFSGFFFAFVAMSLLLAILTAVRLAALTAVRLATLIAMGVQALPSVLLQWSGFLHHLLLCRLNQ